jgi:2-polyprenyl-3-methyl-5-hydroxy-6-metoxy-1,4-benzoquinol methylase
MKRDYNTESKDNTERKYGYTFDYDVLHHYMIKAFFPSIINGNALELGSFEGRFTERLLELFNQVTCVEASDAAATKARVSLGDQVVVHQGLFEEIQLDEKFDNIFLTHVLEHVDDAVGVLRRINDEWLSDKGRLFLVCPNANAPSRQIAVKMRLISHNSAITLGEAKHGHHRTYSLDTLERDAVAAGLRVVQRTGIFFKALANFQWDKILNTDVISQEYLDGCYALGQNYPDLCASIFLLCEKGKK